jgi:hypothetical protein
MAENQYKFKYDEYGNTQEILVCASGVSSYSIRCLNKGTAFNLAERKQRSLEAALPPAVCDFEHQIEVTISKVDKRQDDVQQIVFIRSRFD